MSDIVERLRKWPPNAPKAIAWPADLLREAADEIERLRAATAWRPIESAPKQHSFRVLAFSPYRHNKNKVFVARYHVPANPEYRSYWMGTENSSQPTHWMPLPAPPEAKDE